MPSSSVVSRPSTWAGAVRGGAKSCALAQSAQAIRCAGWRYSGYHLHADELKSERILESVERQAQNPRSDPVLSQLPNDFQVKRLVCAAYCRQTIGKSHGVTFTLLEMDTTFFYEAQEKKLSCRSYPHPGARGRRVKVANADRALASVEAVLEHGWGWSILRRCANRLR